jgi:hypothetical protein
MKRIILAAAASAFALAVSAPASAVTYVQNLGTVTVPPDAFFTPSLTVAAGAVDAYYNFTLTSTFTLNGGAAINGASFTSTNPSAVAFNTVGVYAGTAAAGATGAPTGQRFGFNNVQEVNLFGNAIGYTPVSLAAGNYTIYLSGNAATANTIGSSIRFSSPIPEPATWGLMLLGFGMVGTGLRARRQTRVTFA